MSSNFSIIVEAPNADFNSHRYSAIYVAEDVSVTINNTLIYLVRGSILPISVRSITPTAKVYLMGNNTDVYEGSSNVR